MDLFNCFIVVIIFGMGMNKCHSIRFIVSINNMIVNTGENVSLECTADQTPIYYTWEYKQINNASGTISTILGFCFTGKPCVIKNWHSQIKISNRSRLMIHNISSLNSGRYVCETSSSDGSGPITASAIITVKTPPKSISIHFNRSKNVFQENEYIAIQCSVFGSIPPPRIYIAIVKNDKINQLKINSESPQQLVSTAVEVSAISLWRPSFQQHHGFIMCTAINDAGNLTRNSSLLNIKYEPKIKKFSTSTIVAMVNQTIDLLCDVTANPPASVHWVIMNGLRRIDSSELITKIKADMAGKLTCKAKNSIGSRSKSLLLVVLKDPVITIEPTYRAKENADYSILCTVDAVPQPDFIKWYKMSNNSDSSNILVSNNAKLYFIRTDRSSAGIYTCVTQNTQVPTNGKKKFATSEKSTRLIITYKPGEPRITNDYTISIKQGDPFNLKCSFNDKNPGEPFPILKWIDADNKDVVSESDTFEVRKSESKHNGRFHCMAKNQIGSTLSFEIATVFVYESPSVIFHEVNTKIYLSYSLLPQSIDFSCTFRGQPLEETKWRYGDDIILSPSQEYKIDIYKNKSSDRAALIFSRLTINLYSSSFSQQTTTLSSPNGKYNCEARNKHGMASIDYFLIIKYPPFIRKDQNQRKIAAMLNDRTAVIRCRAESISPIFISWYKTNDHVNLSHKSKKYPISINEMAKYDSNIDMFSPNILVSELTIRELELDDFTNYTCVANNDQGIRKENFELVFKSSPDPPNDLKVQNLEWDSVTISWAPGFNGGLDQNFEIQVTSDLFGLQNVPFYSDKAENTLTITGLHPSTHYEIRIYAINSMGRSTSSSTVKCVTKRIHKFDNIRAEILPDQPKIAVVVPESDICANLEYTRDNGRQWFNILHCVRFNASHINETVLLDITRITSILDLQSGLIHLRLTFCLLSRPRVCSMPRNLENPRNENFATQTVILVIAVICFLLIIILIALFIVCCIRFRYHCIFCNEYYCCGCCFPRLYNNKNQNNRHYDNRKTLDGKPISCSRVSCEDNLDEVDITAGCNSNYCSSLIGSSTPHIMNKKYPPNNSSNEIYSSFICPHHEFRPPIPILYEGSSFLQPTVLSWSQKISPPSCEASSSHSHSSTGSSGRNLPQNPIHYRKKQDVISNNSIINLKSYTQLEEKIKLPDVTSEAIHFVKSPYDDKIIEAVV